MRSVELIMCCRRMPISRVSEGLGLDIGMVEMDRYANNIVSSDTDSASHLASTLIYSNHTVEDVLGYTLMPSIADILLILDDTGHVNNT